MCDPDEGIVNVDLFQECKLIRDSGRVLEALQMLEPVELDILHIQGVLKSKISAGVAVVLSAPVSHPIAVDVVPSDKASMPDIESKMQREHLANRLVLAAKWMIEGKHRHGETVLERFLLALDLRPKWEEAAFELARYMDVMLSSHLSDEEQKTGCPTDDMLTHYVYALEYYGKTAQFGHKYVIQALPRLLTLWTTFCARTERDKETAAATSYSKRAADIGISGTCSKPSSLESAQKGINKKVGKVAQSIAASTWYSCIPLLVSRTGHINPETLRIIRQILVRVVTVAPRQSVWHLAGLLHSLNADRRAVGRGIVDEVIANFTEKKRLGEATMLKQAIPLFGKLVELAQVRECGYCSHSV